MHIFILFSVVEVEEIMRPRMPDRPHSLPCDGIINTNTITNNNDETNNTNTVNNANIATTPRRRRHHQQHRDLCRIGARAIMASWSKGGSSPPG